MKKWEKLAADLQQESAIMGYRNTAENLRALYERDLASTHHDTDEIVAFAALWPAGHPDWFELGSVWVKPNHRGFKHGSSVFAALVAKKPKEMGIMLITHSVDPIIHLALKHGFRELAAPDWDTHLPYAVTCAPCDHPEKDSCPLKAGECRLFFLP